MLRQFIGEPPAGMVGEPPAGMIGEPPAGSGFEGEPPAC